MAYAFLPPMGYQLCFLSHDQLFILPQNCFDSPCDSLLQALEEPDDKLLSKPSSLESPKLEHKIASGQEWPLGGGVCAEMSSKGAEERARG